MDYANLRESATEELSRMKVDIPFSESEAARFRAFIASTGRVQGSWVRLAILAAIAREEHLATLRPELTPQGLAAATTHHPGLCAAAVAPVVDPTNKGETA